MAAYRLYELDGSGRFSAAEWIEADDDDSAASAARTARKGCRCELWCGPRLIATIAPASDEPAPSP